MKKLKVNTEGCIGCGACFSIDPEHFTSNDEGLSVVKSEKNIDPDAIQNIIAACPVGVISYEECGCEHCECEDCHCENDEKAA